MQRRKFWHIENDQHFNSLYEKSFGNDLDARKIKEQKMDQISMRRGRKNLQVFFHHNLSKPKMILSLKQLGKMQQKSFSHHTNPITKRNIHKDVYKSNDRSKTRVFLKIPKELQDTKQMIYIEKMASMQRSRFHELIKNRFSVRNLGENSQAFKNQRQPHRKTVSQLDFLGFKQKLLKINISKFKSEKWKHFKKKKYIDNDILSIKPSKISNNTKKRQSIICTKKSCLLQQGKQNRIKLHKIQKQFDTLSQMEAFSPWESIIE